MDSGRIEFGYQPSIRSSYPWFAIRQRAGNAIRSIPRLDVLPTQGGAPVPGAGRARAPAPRSRSPSPRTSRRVGLGVARRSEENLIDARRARRPPGRWPMLTPDPWAHPVLPDPRERGYAGGVPNVKATPKPRRCVRPAPPADAGRPTVHGDGWAQKRRRRVGARAPDHAGHAPRPGATPASPGAWRVRPRRARGRHAPSPPRPLNARARAALRQTGTPDHDHGSTP